jgi:uncharacterized membrane protein YphA (DoxX/SURF4 family)
VSTATATLAPTRRAVVLDWFGVLARLIVGGVMLVAGGLKVGDPELAGAAVQAYRLMPPELARTIGYALPAFEVALGLLLIVGLFTRVVAAICALLLVAFVVGIVSVWVRGYSIDCGCFGGGGDVSDEGLTRRYTTEIVRDLGLIGLSAFLVWLPHTALSLDRWMHPSHSRNHADPVLDEHIDEEDA